MSKARKIIIYGILILITIVILAGAFYYYTKIKRTYTDPLKAIPSNTALFFELHDPLQTIQRLEKENELWKALKGIPQFQSFADNLVKLDTLLAQHDEVKSLFAEKKIYISLHQNEGKKTEALYLFGLDPSLTSYRIHDFIISTCSDKCMIKGTTYNNVDLEYLISDTTVNFIYTIFKGVFIGSISESMVKASVDQLTSGNSITNKSFEKLRRTAGKKVDANIYIQHSSFNKLLKDITAEDYHENVALLRYLGLWSETDLIIKRDELLLNGYTDAIDSSHQFLNVFAHHKPQEIGITRILPYNTNFIMCMGLESFERYYHSYDQFLDKQEQTAWQRDILNSFNQKLNTDLIKTTSTWIGNEIALVVAGYTGGKQNIYTLLHLHDKDKGKDVLAGYSTGDPIDYKDYMIRKVIGNYSIPAVFGRSFQGVNQQFYVQVDDYLVFGENPGALEQFINTYLSGKTLKRNENYKQFADNLSDKSNIFIYLNIRNSTDLTKKYLSHSFADLINDNLNVFTNIEGIAAQFSYSNNMFYTSIYAKYNPGYVQEDLSIWKAILDAEIYGQPYFVKDHRTNTLKIIVFDKDHQMYMIDHNGRIMWKIPIGEAVISDVYPVDFYKNGKIQYMFNTESHIYLIDLLGRPVSGFPIKLSPKATNGLSVFDYEGQRNYRVLIALEDNRIYNFDKQGLPIRGWKKSMAKEMITRQVEHVRMRGKDYLVSSDIKGQVMILNRKGQHRINLKEDYLHAEHSTFYPNRTNSAKGIILTTDRLGKLTYIKTNGRLEQSDFGEFSPGHHFLYEDFDNNGHKDFIYLDKNELIVFDRFKERIMQHTFKDEISSSPVIIPVSENRNIIGIVSDANRKIYLFDNEGNLVSTPDMIGKTQILVGSLLNDGQLNLIVGSGNTLYNYYFQ